MDHFFVRKRELQDGELVCPFHHPQFCLFYYYYFFWGVEYRCTKTRLIWWGEISNLKRALLLTSYKYITIK
ncbi:hypothetical protein IMSAG049_00092 [Clostridiales bacterium]|nr:hypothetical protein IMSAG049_00092 [Clostridiales bacterium]